MHCNSYFNAKMKYNSLNKRMAEYIKNSVAIFANWVRQILLSPNTRGELDMLRATRVNVQKNWQGNKEHGLGPCIKQYEDRDVLNMILQIQYKFSFKLVVSSRRRMQLF